MSLKKKAPKRRIGYARVSTEAQDLARQLKALRRVPCDAVFSDKASGKSLARIIHEAAGESGGSGTNPRYHV